MFGRLFRKKPYRDVRVAPNAFSFLGEPGGDGVGVLKQELSTILAREGNTTRAYLCKIKYRGEAQIRVALIIDDKRDSPKMAEVIARECRPVASIDIMFVSALNRKHIDDLQQKVAAFFEA